MTDSRPVPELVDPVCGMTVKADSPLRTTHAGHAYLFCNPRCLAKFEATPDHYLEQANSRQRPPAPATSHGTKWTCPMHPEVISDAAAGCPLCGMPLEPVMPSAHPHDDAELVSMSRRLIVAAVLTLPVLLISMGGMFAGAGHTASRPSFTVYLELLLSTPVCLWAAAPLHARARASIANRSANMFTLISLGVLVSYGYSVFATLFPGSFPSVFRDHGEQVAVYFEAATSIVTLVLLGQVLELRARRRTGDALRSLMSLVATSARRVDEDGTERDVPLEAVRVGDRLRVRPGAKVPVDGVVLEGDSSVSEALVTGEPLPAAKHRGSMLIGSTQNHEGSLLMRAEKVGADTLLSRIVALVAQAQRSRAPIQQLADTVSAYFVPAVVASAVLTFVIWGSFGPEPRFAHALVNAVAVLIIACPCALGLATPMSIMVATGKAATLGVLFKNAEAIEALRKADTLIVDKTGTLTEGHPAVTSVVAADGVDESTLLRLAASLERASEHPLGAAIIEAARLRGLALVGTSSARALPARGIVGSIGGMDVSVGTLELMRERNVQLGSVETAAERLREAGDTLAFVAEGTRVLGVLGVNDPIKGHAKEALAALRAEGMRIVMLTGDHERAAHAVARELEIGEVFASVSPESKGRIVSQLREQGRFVAMAGDGINDAPALALAHVGIAMGTGTDIAMESAQVTLVKGDLRGLVRARRLARLTLANVKQNLFFAFAYNLLGVPIAAGALYPFTGVLLSPMLAAAAMSVSSASVIANALRLHAARV
jgi:Cu+-exporting ATPase